MTSKPGSVGSLVLLAVLVFLSAARAAEKTEAETTRTVVQSALVVAASKLKEDARSSTGKNLLRFVLGLDPGNEEALLLQGRLERKLPIDSTAPENAEATFVELALAAAKNTESRTYQLLLCRVVDMLRPGNKIAMVVLTKAQNDGQDTRFESLLRAYTGAHTKIVKRRTLKLPVTVEWPFKVKVKKGDRIRIVARGTWKPNPRGPARGIAGKWYLRGQLGAGEPFKIGKERTLVVAEDTVLYLGMKEPGAYGDNKGNITVTLQKLKLQ